MNILTNTTYALRCFLAACLGCLLAACSSHSNEPVPPLPEADGQCTILVYMVATNNLGSGNYDKADIEEMKEAAINGHISSANRLIIYHAPYRGLPMLKEVKPNGDIDTLKVYDQTELSVSVARMQRALADAKSLAPADSYGMVLWSHSTGWIQDGIAEEETAAAAPGMAYSYGSDNGKRMNITSLQKALEGQDLDFVYFDCCYMGSVETLYQLRNVAGTMIASPTEVPVKGMPYQSTLKHLFKKEYVAAARSTYEYYDSTYSTLTCPVSVTVVNSKALDALAQATREVYSAAAEAWPQGYSPQPFSLRPYYYYDLDDYAKTLAADDSAYAKWRSALDDAIEFTAAESSIWGEFPITRYGGLSTYIFTDENDKYLSSKNYRELDWWTDVASHLPLSAQ